MSQRYVLKNNKNQSKNTRLPIVEDFKHYRFNRDELAHVSRYLFACEFLINLSKKHKKPLKVLDIGCGDIYIARTLSSTFHIKNEKVIKKYVGVDIDKTLMEKVGKNKPAFVDLVLGDLTDGITKRFKDDEFDLVICMEVIEHLDPKFIKELLVEIKRVGKSFIISTPNFEGGTGKIPQDHIKEWKYSELKELLDLVGFKILDEVGVFCNLNKISKSNETSKKVYNFLKGKVDSNFLSIIMAKFLGKDSQNLMRIMTK